MGKRAAYKANCALLAERNLAAKIPGGGESSTQDVDADALPLYDASNPKRAYLKHFPLMIPPLIDVVRHEQRRERVVRYLQNRPALEYPNLVTARLLTDMWSTLAQNPGLLATGKCKICFGLQLCQFALSPALRAVSGDSTWNEAWTHFLSVVLATYLPNHCTSIG
ncbi:hypothetical protein C8R46DRAFT_1023646 [Mycena filopes]|nr:hypothetical protein C8R46DRAFT_1023646 [Mycena filopes]